MTSEHPRPPVPKASTWQQSVFDQLHQVAERALARETPGHSLQPTMLVNDAYLRLLEQRNVDAADRSQVMAVGANMIRRMLVDHARRRKAAKRGGPTGRGVPLSVSIVAGTSPLDILELHDALTLFSQQHARAAQIVELKFFGGLTVEEIAAELKVSVRTVHHDWRFAKAWLFRALGGQATEQ